MLDDLTNKRCRPYAKNETPLNSDTVNSGLGQIPGWSVDQDCTEISRRFEFKNYYETMAFVNALAWIAHREDHHPDIDVGYKHCRVRYATHSIGGLSENDFICAAMLNQLVGE
jgi:4a-hydroxytetrahydrobiopterin dehydratase